MAVAEVQRSRMLSSTVQVVSELGYQKMSVARVAGRARVSRRTFYDLFDDRDDCFLAAFDEATARVSETVGRAYRQEEGAWREKVRAALSVLLAFLDEAPGMRSLLIVDALKAGPTVLRRRAEILERLGMLIQDGGSAAKSARGVPPLTGEGVVSAVLGVIHARLQQDDPGQMLELLNPLMSVIVLPYLGAVAAQRELARPAPKIAARVEARERNQKTASDPLAGLTMRLTYRTLRVLSAIGRHPATSNREVADLAEVADQGQMSKLLSRLEGLGLIEDTSEHGHRPTGEPNAWRLTSHGEEVERAVGVETDKDDLRVDGKREESR